jgi:cyclic-di-GMP phosphodiesterase TipF (flagellum assembly factor)
MGILRHVMIAITYGAVAAALAFALPQAAGIGQEIAALIAALAFLGGALLHEVYARQEAEGRDADDIYDMRLAQSDLSREVAAVHGELTRLQQAMAEATTAKFDALAAEVRVLQDLVDKIAMARPRAAPAIAPAARALRAEAAASTGTLPVARGLDDDAILNVVRDGLRADRIDLYLQPIMSLPQRQRRYFEAFTRIRDGEGKMLVPEQYIGIAEREGLIAAIDNMLLFRCVQLVRRAQRRNQNVGFFCNLSAHTLADRAFVRDFVEFMARNAELAPDIFFELPQAAIAGRDRELEHILDRLGAMGFRFSMDQVGSFRFDYEWLAERRFRFVKLDAATLVTQLKEPTAQTAMRTMKRALRAAGVGVIVEKIETESALLDLLDFEIDFGQGYLFGEPRLSRA